MFSVLGVAAPVLFKHWSFEILKYYCSCLVCIVVICLVCIVVSSLVCIVVSSLVCTVVSCLVCVLL